ncbi:MAG: hypothetical protein ACYC9P_07310 [Rudaea sp.]
MNTVDKTQTRISLTPSRLLRVTGTGEIRRRESPGTINPLWRLAIVRGDRTAMYVRWFDKKPVDEKIVGLVSNALLLDNSKTGAIVVPAILKKLAPTLEQALIDAKYPVRTARNAADAFVGLTAEADRFLMSVVRRLNQDGIAPSMGGLNRAMAIHGLFTLPTGGSRAWFPLIATLAQLLQRHSPLQRKASVKPTPPAPPAKMVALPAPATHVAPLGGSTQSTAPWRAVGKKVERLVITELSRKRKQSEHRIVERVETEWITEFGRVLSCGHVMRLKKAQGKKKVRCYMCEWQSSSDKQCQQWAQRDLLENWRKKRFHKSTHG